MESSNNSFQGFDNGDDLQQILDANLFNISEIDLVYFEKFLYSPCQKTTTASNSHSRTESSGESESDSQAWAEHSTSASYSPPSRAGSSGGAGSPAHLLQPEPYVELYVPPSRAGSSGGAGSPAHLLQPEPYVELYVPPSRAGSSGGAGSPAHLLQPEPYVELYVPPSRAGSSGGAGSPAHLLQPEHYVELYVPPNATSPYRYQRDLDKEKRHSGVIPGPRGTSGRATHPTIKLYNYSGHATRRPLVVACCITDEEPYRAHPNKLFGGKDTIEIVGGMGVGYINHNNEFPLCKVGILRVRKDEIKESLQERAQAVIGNLSSSHVVFPLQNGVDLEFGYKTALLRLAFHVFLPVGEDGWSPLQPVISDVVRLVKSSPATSQLVIDEIYPVLGSTEGGTMIIIYIKKGNVHNNLRVVFIEEDERGWEEDAHIKKIKNRTIVVVAPKYEGRPTSPGGRARVSMYVCNLAGERVSDAVPYIYYQARRTPPATDVRYSVPPADAELDEPPGSSSRAESSTSSSEEANEAPAPPDSTVEESQYIPDANAIEVMKKFGHLKL